MDLTTVDHLLTTTRSVRKRLDLTRPVESEMIERCTEIALQAPTGSNIQGWHFVAVTDSAKRAALAELYRQGHTAYYRMQQAQPPQYRQDDLRAIQRPRVGASSLYLRDHMQEVPVQIIPCIQERMAEVPHLSALAQYEHLYHASIYGSIFPAIWSLMLALRARGVGSSLTTLHPMYEREAAALLGIPDHVMQVALLPIAYFKGTDFKPAKRLPARQRTSWNSWGQTH